MCGFWKLRALWMMVAAASLIPVGLGQSSVAGDKTKIPSRPVTEPGICAQLPETGVKAALRLVCFQNHAGIKNRAIEKAIIIGFVGGFVRPDDGRHPEVQFASYLRQTYPSEVHAEVFANHDGKHALRRVLQLLGKDGYPELTSREKQDTRIIIYGHSWGASQVVNLARDLGRLDIPVYLTVLVDSVHKPGHRDAVIPQNVQNAVNFYQTKGIIHGRAYIRAADSERTNIIGNFQMTYRDRQINCDNYSWIARHLNRPHHEIENDPVVWQQIASLIDSALLNDAAMAASLPSN